MTCELTWTCKMVLVNNCDTYTTILTSSCVQNQKCRYKHFLQKEPCLNHHKDTNTLCYLKYRLSNYSRLCFQSQVDTILKEIIHICCISFPGDVSNKNIKEIGGLEERLNILSKLCDKARTLGQEQSDMAQVILFPEFVIKSALVYLSWIWLQLMEWSGAAFLNLELLAKNSKNVRV